VPTWTRPQAGEFIAIVRKAGKSITQMKLWRHQMTAGDLYISLELAITTVTTF